MTTASAIEFAAPPVRRQSLWRYWRGGLRGSEFTWAVAFLVPYIGVFFAFVVYPICYGVWMGSKPALYDELFSDPIYQQTVVNTLLFLAFGVNLKLFLALLTVWLLHAPGLVDQRPADDLRPALGGAGAADVHLDPLDAERRMGPDQQLLVHRLRCRRPVMAQFALARPRLGRSAPMSGSGCRSGP